MSALRQIFVASSSNSTRTDIYKVCAALLTQGLTLLRLGAKAKNAVRFAHTHFCAPDSPPLAPFLEQNREV